MPRMEYPVVSIIVITLNTPRLTRPCLDSVFRNTTVPYELIVINNTTAESMKRYLSGLRGVRVIQNEENVGFSRAANQGALLARGRYICLLNTDTLVPPGWLERLVEAADRPGVAMVGPASDELYAPNPGGKPWPFPFRPVNAEQTARIDKIFQRRRSNRLESVPYLNGFCLLISRLAMCSLGLFDTDYYFGVEDLDYSLRLRLKGYQLVRVNSLFVHHRQGASSRPGKRAKLIEDARSEFVEKWTTPLEKSRMDYPLLMTRLDKIIPLRKRIRAPLPPAPVVQTARRLPAERFLRTGFICETPQKVLVRFQGMEAFSAAPALIHAWGKLQGGVACGRNGHGPEFHRFLEEFGKNRLLRKVNPVASRRCLVSVMIAARQAEAWIDQTIESVLAQSFQDFELIVADDGSLDGTRRILRRYAWHPKVRLLFNPCQQGISVTRNRILSEARGRYIAVCDSDDIMLPGHLRRMVSVMERSPRAGWIYGDRILLRPGGLPYAIEQARPPNGKIEWRINVIGHAGALIRKEAMEAMGGYDEGLLSTEDYDLALKIARKWRFRVVHGRPQYMWRRHPDSHSTICPWTRVETDRLLRRAKAF